MELDARKIYISLLGSPCVRYGDEEIHVTRKRVRALLFYLAAQNQPVPRSRISYLLWPELDSAGASKNLSIHVSYLKTTLGSSAVVSNSECVTLSPDIVTDIRLFDDAVRQGGDGLADALKLFRGSFLDGFNLGDAPAYEQWRTETEAYLAGRFVEAAIGAARQLSDAGRYDEALVALDAAQKLDPLQESLCRLQMNILSVSGNRSSVSKVYLDFVALLNDELGVPPAPETVACYQRIIAGADSAPQPVQPKPDNSAADTIFVGRQAIMKELFASSSDRFVLLQGKSGLGKTRLMNEYTGQSGAMCIPMRFRQQEQDIPYSVVIQSVRSMMRADGWSETAQRIKQTMPAGSWAVLCRLIPELSHPGSAQADFVISTQQVLAAFEQLLTCIIGGRRAIISIDDIHFADNSSLQLFHYLATLSSFGGVSFIATYRPSLAHPKVLAFFNAMLKENRLLTVEVGKLGHDDLMELLLYYFPEIDLDRAEGLIALADGNPYWMKTIIRGLDSGFTEFSGRSSLDGMFNMSLHSLSPQALDVIYALAVFGGSCDASLFGEICARSCPGSSERLFGELLSANLISRDLDGNIAFSHATVYEYVCERVNKDPKKVQALHLSLAEAMQAVCGGSEVISGPQSITVTDHYVLSRFPKRCAEFAYRAGCYLMTLDKRKQANHYFKLAYSYLDLPHKLDVIFTVYDNMILLGQNYEASIYIRDALDTAADADLPEYVHAFSAMKKLSQMPEYAELLMNITPSYELECGGDIINALTEAKNGITADSTPVFKDHVYRLLSVCCRMTGDFERASKCLWRIISPVIINAKDTDMMQNMLAFSAIVDLVSILNIAPDPQVGEVFALKEQLISGKSIKSFLCSNLCMRALLMNLQGDTDGCRSLMNSAISEARHTGNALMLGSYLATQAMLLHNEHPEKSYSMNYEAYTLSKNANARYTLVNALTGLVITSTSPDEKRRFFGELSTLVSDIGVKNCAKLETAQKAISSAQ